MRKSLLLLVVVGLLIPVRFAPAASISGKIKNPEKCLGVEILERKPPGKKTDSRKPLVRTATYDKKAGLFRAENLPAGTFDIRLLIKDGMMDGVDLRPELIEDDKEKFTPKDEKAIKELIANMPSRFMDTMRPIFIKGKGSSAKALVELIRYRQFHSGKEGDLVWRVEVWTFRKWTGAWIKKQRSMTVICRVRVPQEMKPVKFKRLVWIFSPDLGGIELKANERRKGIAITVPKPSADLGKVPGSVEKQIEEYQKKQNEMAEAMPDAASAVTPSVARAQAIREVHYSTVRSSGSWRRPCAGDTGDSLLHCA